MSQSNKYRDAWMPTEPEELEQIQRQLEAILSSVPFRNSRRYPAMLRYIVEQTLAGNADMLKERTIGIEVFHRSLDYDTNADPVVRSSAGEVRKRIALFYQDGENPYEIEFELPIGSYVPVFRPKSTTAIPAEVVLEPVESVQTVAEAKPFGRRWLIGAGLVAAMLLLGVPGYRKLAQPSPLMTVWQPLLDAPGPALISVGRPHPLEEESPELPDTNIKNHILRPEFRVSMTTVAAISNVAGFLQQEKKTFRLHEAYSNTLADLHGQPVILVNGNNNKWTLLLMKSLRFHFVSEGDFSYIEDAKNPDNRDWSVDFTKPYLQQTTDYAIVARFNDATTGGPVLVIAGISSNGTDAAGQFIVSPSALNELARRAPLGWRHENFEAVLKVEVVGGNTGAVNIVATNFW